MFWWKKASEAAASGNVQEQHRWDCTNSNSNGDSSSKVVSYSDS